MGFLDIFKSKKKKELANVIEGIFKELFPGGMTQVDADLKKLQSSFYRTHNQDQLKKIYLYSVSLFYVTNDKSEDSIITRIIKNPYNCLNMQEAKILYSFLTHKIFRQSISDDEDLINTMSANVFGGNKGFDLDEIPGGIGNFGYDVTNPIPVKGIVSNEIYLESLRTSNGNKIEWERIGSTTVENIEDSIDIYQIYDLDGNKLTILYISPYHKRISMKTPKGFIRV